MQYDDLDIFGLVKLMQSSLLVDHCLKFSNKMKCAKTMKISTLRMVEIYSDLN